MAKYLDILPLLPMSSAIVGLFEPIGPYVAAGQLLQHFHTTAALRDFSSFHSLISLID